MEWILEVAAQVISAAVGAAVFWYFTKGADRKLPTIYGRIELRMSRWYLALGIMGVLLGTASLATLFFEDAHIHRTFLRVLGALCTLIFLGTGLPCVLYYRNHRVIYTESEFMLVNVWGDLRTYDLSQVVSIELNKWTGLFQLKTKSGLSLKVHTHLIGVTGFLNLIREKNHLGKV